MNTTNAFSSRNAPIFLHVGHGKTGSSFIQSSLAVSAPILAEHGVLYPVSGPQKDRALAGHVNMGNFAPKTGKNYHLPGEYGDLIAGTDDNGAAKLLFSNEAVFTSITNFSLLDEIREASKGRDVHLLMVIRDPLDHAISGYQQNLKEGRIQSIDMFLRNYSFLNRVKKFFDIVKNQPVTLTVRNYSRHKKSLPNVFEQWLELPPGTLKQPPVEKVNRSLTRAEMQLQIAFHRHVGRRARIFVSDALSNELPDIPSEKPYISAEALQEFLPRMQKLVQPLNDLIPESEWYHVPTLEEAMATMPSAQEAARFYLTAEQMDVLARNMARFFKPDPRLAAK